jgi:hypothetical protein
MVQYGTQKQKYCCSKYLKIELVWNVTLCPTYGVCRNHFLMQPSPPQGNTARRHVSDELSALHHPCENF